MKNFTDIKAFSRMINLGGLVALVVCCLIGYQVVRGLFSNRVTQLNQQAAQLQNSLNRSALMKVKVNQLYLQKKEHDATRVELPPRVVLDGVDQLNQLVARCLKESGMRVNGITPSESELELTGHCLSVSAEGSFEKTCRLLDQLEPLPANVRIESLTITVDKDQPVLKVEMRIGLENANQSETVPGNEIT